ncbi:HIRAN domain-containing protein [Fundicoccus culcitae]|uniref:HIRAN domain-containing protein n=1 Tax=Fundicoccus culcitae TaxID=2969821 RepID=A0ABY5P2T6_9LACT|nr:HIRAN domain-containing protein [Fundicoccus culcitae]UUX33021.1 HIRAN domain-containing protein [Fundicoccus culcitae]
MSDLINIDDQNQLVKSLYQKGHPLSVIKPFERDIYLFSTYIAGTTHVTGIMDLEPTLQVGEPLNFYREPDNPYDKEAIVIKNQYEVKLGYIPRKDNVVFSRLMDAGKLLFGKIKSKERKGNYLSISIDIYLHE